MTQPVALDVVDQLDVLICGLDSLGRIQVFNQPCERLTRMTREDAAGQSWLEIFAIDERRDHVVSLWDQAREEAPSGPFEALCRNGRNIRWQFSRSRPAGAPAVALWAVGIDVTSEREALVRARERDRMIALGNLMSGLTHELRNPLNGAVLQLALAQRSLARSSDELVAPAVAAIAQASAEIRRISTLLDDFLVFVRPQPIRLERRGIRQIIARAIERAGPRSIAADVAIALEPGGEISAEVDRSRLESAVFQLLANAIDAAADAGEHEVHIGISAQGNAIAIEVEDRGAGLASGELPIFEPFFTTKRGGTGLGLAIVQRVAADHGGAVTHRREAGSTVFRLELPIVGGVAH